jgi:hypothetical protein
MTPSPGSVSRLRSEVWAGGSQRHNGAVAVVTLTQGSAEVLLAGIRDMLRADGYEMVIQVGEGEVAVSVVATDGACEECLVPSDLMTEIIRDSLGEGSGGGYVGLVSVQYPTSTAGGGSSH